MNLTYAHVLDELDELNKVELGESSVLRELNEIV